MNDEWQEPKDYVNPPVEQIATKVFILISVVIIALTWEAYSFEKAMQVYFAFITLCATVRMLYKKSIEYDPGFDERDWQQRSSKPILLNLSQGETEEGEAIDITGMTEGTQEWEEVFGGKRVRATTGTSNSRASKRRPSTARKRKEHTTN